MADKDELLNHDYDGIQEYDNRLPKWWLALFWGGFIFGIVYIFYWDFGPGEFAVETVDREVAALQELQKANIQQTSALTLTEEAMRAFVKDEAMVTAGREVFVSKCVVCHADQGQGLIGPNMTDDYWIHGGTMLDIRRTIVDGVLDKGMLAWGTVLSSDEINQVSAYIWTLNGTNPPNPKEPQGELVHRN